jgi:hypothetical protein
MAIHDAGKQLDTVLSYLIGRRLSTSEICGALQMSRTTYYEQREHGRLISADNLIKAARSFGLNEIDLLVRYEFVSVSSAVEYVQEISAASPAMTAAMAEPKSRVRFDSAAPGL